MNKILKPGILYILGLIFPIIVFLSYSNYDYNVRLIYVYFFIVVLFVLFITVISYDRLLFINRNFILVILSTIFFHTFIFFTVIPTKFGFDYEHPVVTAVLFALAFVYVLLIPYKFKRIEVISSFDRKLLLVISILLFLSIFVVNYLEFTYIMGFSKVIIFLLALYFFMYFIPAFIERSTKLLNIFIYTLFMIGFISGFVGIISVYFPSINSINVNPGLSASYFPHPNANAFFYSFTVPCGFYMLYRQRDKKNMIFGLSVILMIIITFINQVLTFSRGGIIAVILGSFIFLFYFYKKYFIFIIVIFSFFLTVLFNFTTGEKGASTIIGRYSLINNGIETLNSSTSGMLFGYGINNNFKEFESNKPNLGVTEPHNYPHNSILFLSLEFGILTVIFLLLYYIKLIIATTIAYFRNKLNLVSLLTFSVVVSVSAHALIEDFVMFPEYYMFHLFLIFIGLHHRFLLKDEELIESRKL